MADFKSHLRELPAKKPEIQNRGAATSALAGKIGHHDGIDINREEGFTCTFETNEE